jgi:cytochrome c-type biogenesis protein CcsB
MKDNKYSNIILSCHHVTNGKNILIELCNEKFSKYYATAIFENEKYDFSVIQFYSEEKQKDLVQEQATSEGSAQNRKKIFSSSKQALLQTVDLWSYRIIGLGFPFLTIGIISGAVWANEAWGSYWSWDPKETWALITWLVFAIYLHSRLIKGWQGQKAAILGSCGFFVIWICYLGVNFLGKGLHSYGWVF